MTKKIKQQEQKFHVGQLVTLVETLTAAEAGREDRAQSATVIGLVVSIELVKPAFGPESLLPDWFYTVLVGDRIYLRTDVWLSAYRTGYPVI